jgi:hypothetical protein
MTAARRGRRRVRESLQLVAGEQFQPLPEDSKDNGELVTEPVTTRAHVDPRTFTRIPIDTHTLTRYIHLDSVVPAQVNTIYLGQLCPPMLHRRQSR